MISSTRTRSGYQLLIALLLLGGAGGAVRAMSLKDYHARVAQADGSLSALFNLYAAVKQNEGAVLAPEFQRRQSTLLAELRAALPATEQVEWAGRALDVDNRWLPAELDAFTQLPATPVAPRTAALTRIDARIHALYERLAEVERAAQATHDKAAEKGRLHAILQRPEFNEQPAQGSALAQLWERFLKWFRSLLPARRPMQPGTSMFISQAARALVYALCVALIAFVLWRYGPRLARRTLTRERERAARVVLGEQLAPEQTPADLLRAAEQLARDGDLRGAMRKAYIAVLCELGERKILRLAPHKTNRDYLRALRADARLFQTVQPLTHAYERHWYGLVPARDADWAEFRAQANLVTSDE